MLTHLSIKNYALIQQLEMMPAKSLNVITGETGAGKSIMLGAIGLLLGNRADSKMLWDENEKCITEATFDRADASLKTIFEEEELDFDAHIILRREISASGKSRAFVNDTPVTLDVMKKIGKRLLDIHSQHETLELGNKNFQLALIDNLADNEALRFAYSIAWKSFKQAQQTFDKLKAEAEQLRQESDFVKYQLDELAKANLDADEQEGLESELKIMEHAEDIKGRFHQAMMQLNTDEFSAASLLASARTQLNPLLAYSPTYAQLIKRLESVKIELADIISEIENEQEKIEFDPARTEQLKQRLSLIYQLLKKHHAVDIGSLLAIQNQLQERADKTNNLDSLLVNAEKKLNQTSTQVTAIAKELSSSRKKIVPSLTKKIETLLRELGIENAQLVIENTPQTPDATGADSIEILFSANKGIVPRSLAQVASGGEFSRLMFAVKFVMAEKTAMPTLILDEIDSGVSGEVAMQLGKLMKTMAGNHQVIAISHLPQIAAKADAHYFVYKDNTSAKTISMVRKLDAQGRVEEIAKMIGGATPSKLALDNAKELIKNN
jgi:DNA repair protein RecN (Recombination protein N)